MGKKDKAYTEIIFMVSDVIKHAGHVVHYYEIFNLSSPSESNELTDIHEMTRELFFSFDHAFNSNMGYILGEDFDYLRDVLWKIHTVAFSDINRMSINDFYGGYAEIDMLSRKCLAALVKSMNNELKNKDFSAFDVKESLKN